MGLLTNLQFAWKHRGQPLIQEDEGKSRSSENFKFYFEQSYDHVEVVRRGVDLIVDSASEFNFANFEPLPGAPIHQGSRQRIKT